MADGIGADDRKTILDLEANGDQGESLKNLRRRIALALIINPAFSHQSQSNVGEDANIPFSN